MSKIPEKCKAMVLEEYGKPDVMREVDIPEVKKGDILVKVQLAGICGTDVHQNLGDLSIKPPTPMIQGHETLGKIVKMDGVTADVAGTPVKEGDRIVIEGVNSLKDGMTIKVAGAQEAQPAQK